MALRSLLAVVALLTMLAPGCAKRPAMTQAAAPAPIGATVTTPAAPLAPAAPPAAAPPPAAPAPTPTPPPVAAAPAPAPPPARPTPAEFRAIPELRDIFFDFDKYAIRPDAARTLNASVDWLKSNPTALVLIEGHCDERGTNAYNLALGERRARATQDYLVNHGVAAARITIISYGEERPVCAEHTEACWAQNRRAHFLTRQP
jgi:peptidoglycan-associated lipoprotein